MAFLIEMLLVTALAQSCVTSALSAATVFALSVYRGRIEKDIIQAVAIGGFIGAFVGTFMAAMAV